MGVHTQRFGARGLGQEQFPSILSRSWASLLPPLARALFPAALASPLSPLSPSSHCPLPSSTIPVLHSCILHFIWGGAGLHVCLLPYRGDVMDSTFLVAAVECWRAELCRTVLELSE